MPAPGRDAIAGSTAAAPHMGFARGSAGARHPVIFGGTSSPQKTQEIVNASMVDLRSCPPITVASLLLDRHAGRLRTYDANRRHMNITKLRTLDGSNHSAFMRFWRLSGVRFPAMKHHGWLSSYGAVAATLGHLNALRWQVHNRLPFLLRAEDDIYFRSRHDYSKHLRSFMCFLTRYLTASRDNNERAFRVIHFHFGGAIGVGADVYLTSLDGAARELRRLCGTGIYNGFDYMANVPNTTLHIGKAGTDAFVKRTNPPSGRGSVVTQLNHFNLSELQQESASWPLERCLRWAGVDEGGATSAPPSSSERRSGSSGGLREDVPAMQAEQDGLSRAMPMPMPLPMPEGWP